MENPHAAKRTVEGRTEAVSSHKPFWPENAFSRQDESDDTVFYETDRFVQHLDSLALSTVEHSIEELIVEENAVILDLMASWDSHTHDEVDRPQSRSQAGRLGRFREKRSFSGERTYNPVSHIRNSK